MRQHCKNTQGVINRLSRAIGHLEAVKRMVEEGRNYDDILIQIASVKSSVNNIGKIILKEHIHYCITEAVKTSDPKIIDEISITIDKLIK